MNICVFCSAQDVAEKYRKDAAAFAALVANHGHTLVWGGSNVGTMKVIADAAQEAGGKLIAISMEFFAHKVRKNADIIEIAKDLAERKARMLEVSDAVISLPGGTGTLDEATEVLEFRRHQKHKKPVLFLNTDGFYDGLKMQLERMDHDGFLASRDGDVLAGLGNLTFFAKTPEQAMDYIEQNAEQSTS